MSLILHLSDLHLGTRDPAFDDAKTEAIPKSERDTRQKAIRRTLQKLAAFLTKNGDHLDAILVTGDISYACDKKGFQDFQSVLGELGDQRPPNNRIAIVPGNHDVPRGTNPSSSQRYEFFRKYIPSNHFITPLLDGIDILPGVTLPSKIQRHYILDRRNKWLVVPVNSSNYCQMWQPITPIPEADWKEFQKSAKKYGEKEVSKRLEELRLTDAARISPEQFDALQALLGKVWEDISRRGENPDSYFRIAILHHHLLPVSTVEEIKKYESFTNLGLLRHFLARQKFDLVLHGHKHIAKRYWDHIPLVNSCGQPSHQLLVISGGTLGETYHAEDEVCRLIRVCPPEDARILSITSIPSIAAGDHLDNPPSENFPFWEARTSDSVNTAPLTRITGKDVDQVYDRILAHFRNQSDDKLCYNLVCQMAVAPVAEKMPSAYPVVEGVETKKREEWFRKMVDWWQLPKPSMSKTLQFTHGHRICCCGDADIDQIKNVITVLTKKPSSSRAVVILCRPETDAVHDRTKKFPSFCLVQFLVRDRSSRHPVLDCIGYFRKQEMKYWWPVNLAELARLQKSVYVGIPKKDDMEHLEIGGITTIAAIARIGKRPPQVAVPIVDRNLDQDRQLLWTMCYALFWPHRNKRKRYEVEWQKVLRELVPEEGFDPDGVRVPLRGLEFLASEVKRFASHHPSADSRELVNAMEQLHQRNEEFVETLHKDEKKAQNEYDRWQRDARELVAKMKIAIHSLLTR